MSSRGSATRAATQVLGSGVVLRIVDFARTILAARLLAPDEFGRFVLAVAVLAAFEIVSQPGLHEALIQSERDDERMWQATWTVLVLRGIVLTALIVGLSEPIASLLGNPDVAWLIALAGLLPLLKSSRSLSVIRRRREVDLTSVLRLRVASQILHATLAITLAATTHSAWGLIAAMLISTAFESILTFAIRGFRPRWVLSREAMTGLFGYGGWRFASYLLWYASTRADDIIVARSLGTSALGSYRVAYQLANLPTTQVTDAVSQVSFPALARAHRESPEQARRDYRRFLLVVSGVSALMAGLLAGSAEALVETLLPAYGAAIVPVMIMAAAGFLRAVTATGGNFFLGAGRPAIDTAMQAVRAVVLVSCVLALVQYGPDGAATASLLSVVAMVPMWLYGVSRLGVSWVDTLGVVARRAPAAIAAALAGAGAQSALEAAPFVELTAAVAAGIAGGGAVVALVDRPLVAEFARLAQAVRSRRRPPPATPSTPLPPGPGVTADREVV